MAFNLPQFIVQVGTDIGALLGRVTQAEADLDAVEAAVSGLPSPPWDTSDLSDEAVTFAKLNTAAVVTSVEGIAGNEGDNVVPTVQAVVDHVASAVAANGGTGTLLETFTAAGGESAAEFNAMDHGLYSYYRLDIENFVPTFDNDLFGMQISDDDAVTFETGSVYRTFFNWQRGANASSVASNADTHMGICSDVGTAASEIGVTCSLFLRNFGSANRCSVITLDPSRKSEYENNGNLFGAATAIVSSDNSERVATDFRLLFRNGNIEAGAVARLYGFE